jgi:hypothetical protein
MSWQNETIQILRIIINDLEETPNFTDERLENVLVVAAHMVISDISFPTDYVVSITEQSITPDPTVANDTAFINLITLKAACIMDVSLFITKALAAGIKARCGPAILDTSGHLAGFKELIEQGPCAAYKRLKFEYEFGDGAVVRAILSPFRGNNFNPQSLNSGLGDHGQHRHGFSDIR